MSSRPVLRIGNQTAASAPSLMEPFEFALANGFRAFEWFPDKTWTEADLDGAARRAIREEARRNGIRLSVHAPLGLDPLNPETSAPAAPALELARAIGAEVFNIHLQPESGIDTFLTAIEGLIRQTDELGLQLALENTPVTGPGDFNSFFELLRGRPDLSGDHVGLCFDLGHANLCGATRNDYLGFLDRLGPRVPLIHVHLHENYGDADTHLPLFTGPSRDDDGGLRGFLERLARRGFSGSAIMEVWPDPPSLLVESRDRLEALLAATRPGDSGPDRSPEDGEDRDEPLRPTRDPGPPSDPFVAELVEADRGRRSWREKLQWIEERLSAGAPPGAGDLAALAVYLRWLHLGRIPCEEDSRHFRPSHHARSGAAIEERLAALTTPATAPVIRRIYPYLPSYDAPFTRAEPLTRIRDIAHRNDIPKELKDEIKHRLQNKLHRCAGPEDLRTSEELLERVASGEYSEDFVAEFRRFHAELKTFFNAQSLTERLSALEPDLPAKTRERLREFLGETGKAPRGFRDALARFRLLTGLRSQLVASLPGFAGPVAQSTRLAEIGLESFAFPVASDLLNRLEKRKTVPWTEALEALSLALAHHESSETFPGESAAIRREIDAIGPAFRADDTPNSLRLKASLDRAQRLCDRVADFVLATFRDRAAALGNALEVPRSDIRLFCEAELRESLTFQLSKLVAFLAGRLRATAGWSDWETVVPGRAAGRFERVAEIDDPGSGDGEPRVLWLDRAGGDEDIPESVAGIFLAHAIPHLSHLSVRARQAKVPFVCSESARQFAGLKASLGKRVRMDVTGETFEIAPIDGTPDPGDSGGPAKPGGRSASGSAARGTARPPDLESSVPVLPLSEVTAAGAGSKADGLRRLTELAGKSERFAVPPTLVVPFGVLASALRNSPEARERGFEQPPRLDKLPDNERASHLKALRELILELPVPEEILEAASREFRSCDALIARSSASAEDAENGAGAGIYASVPNLSLDSLASGIRQVWASLWTEKAVANRQIAGYGADAHMAVILQPLKQPEISFIVHTANPVTRDPDEVYIEAALGSGEILAGAAEPGTPYRLTVDVAGEVRVLAFSSFSHHLVPGDSGNLDRRLADYSQAPLSTDPAFRETFSRRLAETARDVASAFGSPQDIEGFLLDDRLYLVQSRPQQGLG